MADITGNIQSNYDTSDDYEDQRTLHYSITVDKRKRKAVINCIISCMFKNKTSGGFSMNFSQHYVSIVNSKNQEVFYKKMPFSIEFTSNEGYTTKNITVAECTATVDYNIDGTQIIRIFDNYVGWKNIQLPTLSSSYIKIDGIWRKVYAFIKILGVWKRATIWKKINGIWKRGL